MMSVYWDPDHSHVAYILRRFRRVCAAVGSSFCLSPSDGLSMNSNSFRQAITFHLMQRNARKSGRVHGEALCTRCKWTRGRFKRRSAVGRQGISSMGSSPCRPYGPNVRKTFVFIRSLDYNAVFDEKRCPCNPFLQGEVLCFQSVCSDTDQVVS